ncbi:uncharacterized protein LOC112602935 [Melanaphis sacchari]|uniref:uncharacterized protein LOC112602935 n=1 Tax=Melanaphis sacchari TaxID=742174 RepID=UPI000DC1517F|nr:uncharacterized protein LOC112602935 [Melanaphis sacchari]
MDMSTVLYVNFFPKHVLTARSREVGRIDQKLTEQAEDEAKTWGVILRRLISVIVFISERGLAFRGENETFGSPKNGNYLGILELIAKYYSISLDSTPDEGHVDQLTLIFRYLEENIPVERFVAFMPNQGHKSKDMFKGLDTFLKENDLDIQNCRGQSYDNASSMSGKYNSLQALVLAENNLALWVPCAGHSLNLVVQAAAECCLSAVSFFDFLEELYVYFTASTNRYKVLTDCLKRTETKNPILIPKRTKTTRWSCKADATKALLRGYKEIKNIQTGLYAVFWNDILGQVNKTSETLQNPRLDVNTAVLALKSLRSFIGTKRDSFEEYVVKVAELDDFVEYDCETQRKRKINLDILDDKKIILAAQNLVKLYDNDLDDQLGNELIQFKAFYQEFLKDDDGKNDKVISQERWMYQLLIEKNVKDYFPNIEVALRMYLSLMVTNSSGERSFSKLKLIKNRLRTSMTEERLNTLALLSIESDILRQINYEDIISDFINTKLRRKLIKV